MELDKADDATLFVPPAARSIDISRHTLEVGQVHDALFLVVPTASEDPGANSTSPLGPPLEQTVDISGGTLDDDQGDDTLRFALATAQSDDISRHAQEEGQVNDASLPVMPIEHETNISRLTAEDDELDDTAKKKGKRKKKKKSLGLETRAELTEDCPGIDHTE